jgi:hypothetical protein
MELAAAFRHSRHAEAERLPKWIDDVADRELGQETPTMRLPTTP